MGSVILLVTLSTTTSAFCLVVTQSQIPALDGCGHAPRRLGERAASLKTFRANREFEYLDFRLSQIFD
jgi:hypothetical protein